MPRWKPAPVIGGAYSDDAKAWSDQDTVNWIPVVAERGGTRTPTMLRDAPGLIVISDLGTNAPIRGTHNVEGLLLAVSGNKLFKIGVDGAGTEIGTIPGVERVSMAHNQITGGNEVAIANGQSGYVYNTVTETLTQITDDGFPGAISFDFCDGYIMGIEPGRRFGFHSQLAAAGDYNTLDRYEAEGSPDKLVGQIVTHREWWLFGERTIEPYVNTGAATGTFQRASGTVMQKGLASRWAVAQIDNSVMWLGSDGVVYRAEGYNPVRKSTHAIEQAIARCNTAQAFAFVFDDRGHQIFYLTFPDGQTWGYDAASGEWHRRQSYGFDRWRINTLTKWRGVWVAGDYTNGRLYQLDWNTSNEAGEVLERRRITGVLNDNQNPVTVNGVALVFDTGAEGVSKPISGGLTIAGDLKDGAIGDVVSYQYMVAGGVLPRGGVTVSSGSLPDGLSISSTGLVTGTRGAPGDYTWQLRVTDAAGNVAILRDSSSTTAIYATWEPMTLNSGDTLNATFDVLTATTANKATYSTIPARRKCYFEIQANNIACGIGAGDFDRRALPITSASGTNYLAVDYTGAVTQGGTSLGLLSVTGTNFRVRFVVDPDTRSVWVGAVGQDGWLGGGNPSTGTLPTAVITGNGLLWAAASSRLGGGTAIATLCANPSSFTGGTPSEVAGGLYAAVDNSATTLDPEVTGPFVTLSDGNLKALETDSTLNVHWTVCTRIKRSGKAYWEVTAQSGVVSQPRASWGVSREGTDYLRYINSSRSNSLFFAIGSDGKQNQGGDTLITGGISTGDIIRNKLDVDAGTYSIAVNGGEWVVISNTLSNVGWRVAFAGYQGSFYPEGGIYNFGASAFSYAVPDGYDAGWLA